MIGSDDGDKDSVRVLMADAISVGSVDDVTVGIYVGSPDREADSVKDGWLDE